MATVQAFIRVSQKKIEKTNIRFRLRDGRKIQLFHVSEIQINPDLFDSKKQKVKEGTVIVTGSQQSGKGLGENKWESEPHKNLTLSIIFYPDFLKTSKQFLLNKIAALAVSDFIKTIVRHNQVNVKWPNDVFIDNYKSAGILIETSTQNNILEYAVIGIGLNINQTVFRSDAPNPTSLKLIEARDFDLNQCFNELVKSMDERYFQLKQGEEDEINYDYLNSLYLYQKDAKYKIGEENFMASIIGISDIGKLILQKENGRIIECNFKEVEFLNR